MTYRTWRCVHTITQNGIYSCLSFSPDGQTIATCESGEPCLWSVQTGELEKKLIGDIGHVESIAFSVDGQIIFSCGGATAKIKLWSIKEERKIEEVSGHSEQVWSIAISPDGQTLASASKDKTIKLWSVQKEGFLLWSTTKLRARQTLIGHSDEVTFVRFSPDGQTLASGSKDGTIKLWSLQTLKMQRTITGYKSGIAGGHDRSAFSHDGKIIAAIGMVNDKSKIKLWSVQTGELLQILNSTTEEHGIWSVAISPDGKIIAGGTFDTFAVKLWSVETGQEIQTLTGHSKPVTAVAFSPNGQTLASGSVGDRTTKLWRMN